MEKDEAARPVDVRARRADAVVLVANALADLIEETWPMGCDRRRQVRKVIRAFLHAGPAGLDDAALTRRIIRRTLIS